jgi:hypothetical protein
MLALAKLYASVSPSLFAMLPSLPFCVTTQPPSVASLSFSSTFRTTSMLRTTSSSCIRPSSWTFAPQQLAFRLRPSVPYRLWFLLHLAWGDSWLGSVTYPFDFFSIRLALRKWCGMGVRVSTGCDTRSNSVLPVLPSICIFFTSIGHIQAGSFGQCMKHERFGSG